MKESNTIDIPHVTITYNKIKNNNKINYEKKEKKFLRLECINNDSPSNYSIVNAYLQEFDSFNSKSEYLDSAYVYLSRMDLEIKENFFIFFSIFYQFL